jgi:ATP-dependent Lon protease
MIDEIDKKLLDNFRGYVVRKDLAPKIKAGANVPVFVLEYLLANSCSTDNEEEIQKGVDNVKKILEEHYITPDKGNLIQAIIKNKSQYKIIDRIEVRLDSQYDIYRANLLNSGIRDANISESLVMKHEKSLMGGIWAIIDIGYNPEIVVNNKIFPFVIDSIKPIQLSSFSISDIKRVRPIFTTQEWINILIRSTGLEPTSEGFSERIIWLLLGRLIPLVEANFNMVEFGPKQTGKSYLYKEVSPYALLVSGGQATVAQLFVNNATKKIGLVGLWDVVAFDEAAGIDPKEQGAVQIFKDYMESGSFSRGSTGELAGGASIVFNGNIEHSIESLLKTSHLFEPFSEKMQDTAFLDRIHCYLPGWEMIKLSQHNFTKNFGFSVDYFSEFLRAQRSLNRTDVAEKYFSFGKHLQNRDAKAVKKIVSGLIKLIHPDDNYTKEDVKRYVEVGMEMRRRVKEQLKRMGGMEFWDTNFSYIDKDKREEYYVNVIEEKGSSIIENQPLKPGKIYTVGESEKISLIQIETGVAKGSGSLNISGTSNVEIRRNIKNIFQYIKSNEQRYLTTNNSIENYDISLQLTPLMGNEIGTSLGSAAFVSILSCIYKKELKAGLAVLGDISVGGGIKKCDRFADMVAILSENGARTVLVPAENLKDMQSLPPSLIGKTDISFYSDPQSLIQKAILET